MQCIYEIKNNSFNLKQQALRPTPVTAFEFFKGSEVAGITREKANKRYNRVIIPADTYRDFKTNSIMRKEESNITKNKDGDFRGPAEEKRIRDAKHAKYIKVQENGKTKVEELFEN